MEPMSTAAASTAARNITELKMESPYRYASSIAAISTVIAVREQGTPLSVLSRTFASIRFHSAADWLAGADDWWKAIVPPAALPLQLLAMLALFAVITGTTSIGASRAAATLWLLLFALSNAPASDFSGFGEGIAVTLVGALIFRVTRARNGFSETGAGIAVLLFELLVAALYLPLSFLIWALSAARPGKR